MKTFMLSILAMDRPFFKGECISLVLPVSDGMIGIQADHPPITAAVVPGLVTFTLPDGTVRECVVSRGLFDISKNDPRLLCESVMAPDDVEDEEMRRMLEAAALDDEEEKGRQDYIASQIAFAQAFNKLKSKHGKSTDLLQ